MTTIVKTSDKPAIVITPFHSEAFAILKAGLNARGLMVKKLSALIESKHGKTMMTFAAYSADLDALSQLVRDKGLSASSNHFHVTYRECVTTLYGAIPVSMDGDAPRKRIERMSSEQKTVYDKALADAKAANKPEPVATALAVRAVKVSKSQKVKPTAGAPKGETQEHAPSEKETLRQLVARIGMVPLLDVIVESLNAEKATQSKGKALAQLTAQLVRELKPAQAKTGTNG